MADDESDASDGSDIEADYEPDFDNFDVPEDPLDEDQWVRGFFEDDSSDDEEFEGFQGNWQTDRFRSRVRHAFRRAPGTKIDIPPTAKPIEVFGLIFRNAMWERLVQETNRYAETERKRCPPPPSSKWAPVTIPELKTFIGLCIVMGILQLPEKRDFWRLKKWIFRTNFPQAMSRDRFLAIWRYLHLQDNNDAQLDKSDRLWKVRWYLNYLMRQYRSLYEIHSSATVDESMIKYKGRLSFRQYLPLKPTKWGVKVWVMAESTTGYVTSFQVYTGREGQQEKGLGHRVVMDLTKPYFGSQLSIYMDNFYSSPDLMRDLKVHGIQACGTVRANRKGLPRDLIPRKGTKSTMARHSFKVAQEDQLILCVWQDTKPVSVLSNFHCPSERGTVLRHTAEGQRTQVTVPSCLSDYQAHMKGVDLLDQMIGYYQFNHRSKKWWRRLFFYFLSVSCYNSFVAARSAGVEAFKRKRRMGFKDWLEDLAQDLITPSTTRCAPQPAEPPRGSLDHDMVKLYTNKKVCKECSLARSSTDDRATRTVYGCKQCDVAVHIECFGRHIRRHVLGE